MLTYTKVRPVLHVEVTASVLKPDLMLGPGDRAIWGLGPTEPVERWKIAEVPWPMVFDDAFSHEK